MSAVMFFAVFVALVGWWANEWKRSVLGFVVLALVLSPLVAGIVLLIKGRNKEAQDG